MRAAVGEMERLHAAAAIFRSHPRYRAPGAAADAIAELLRTQRLALVSPDEGSSA